MLRKWGAVQAFEFDDDARAHATRLSGQPVAYGRLPDAVGFENDRFDLIALLDVLEHVDDDVASLKALRERLAHRGSLLLTVPALPWLWSDHDVLHHHKRRYTREALNMRLKEAGLDVVAIGYFNTLLFPLAFAQRLTSRVLGRSSIDQGPPKFVNSVLRAIFAFETNLLGRIPFPIGLSLFAVARKRTESATTGT